MIFKIRAILDTEQDVVRTLLIHRKSSLEDLHYALIDSFGFEPGQMASFYRTDEDWTQGEEIPLMSMDDGPNAVDMINQSIEQTVEDRGEKLLYVYDFFSMWTCFIELIEELPSTEHDLPYLVMSVGERPEQAPEKSFEGKAPIDPYSDEALFGEDFNDPASGGGFENIDDLDLDTF